jgi:hypothetical protein
MKLKNFEITYKLLGGPDIAQTTIRAKSVTNAKMQFVDEGYGQMIHIIDIKVKQDK